MHRSARHHARIAGVDVSAALAVPGVVRVLTHADIPNNWYTLAEADRRRAGRRAGPGRGQGPLPRRADLRRGRRHEAAALEGAARVKVDYEDLPAVFDVEEALAEGAPVDQRTARTTSSTRATTAGGSASATSRRRSPQADHVFEWRYQSAPIEHAPTETTGCIVVPQADGRLRIHSDTQACFFTLDNTALILGDAVQQAAHRRRHGRRRLRRQGRRRSSSRSPASPRMLTGRPVKFVYSRDEEMQVSSPRAAERIYIKDGVMDDGRIIGRKVTLYVDAGAYSRHSPYGTTKAAAHMPGPVHDPERVGRLPLRLHQPHPVERHARLRRHHRRLRAGVADGPHRPGARTWTRCELRLLNAYRDGDMKAHRKVAEGTALIEVIQKAARAGRARAARRVPPHVLDPAAGGLSHGEAARARIRLGQLPDRHEPRRRPLAGADPLHDHGHVRDHAVLGGPRPGHQDDRRASARPRRSACRSRTSSSTPPTPTPARTAWAPSPAAAPTASATP